MITKTRIGNHLRRHALGDQPTFRQGFKEGVEFAKRYITPPQRKPLTDEHITAILERGNVAERNDCCGWHMLPYALARAIEAAHGIKGES